jgi:cell division protein FtsW (lipid II flippase)
MLEKVEKPIHKSKKFIALLFTQVLLAAMAITALVQQPDLGWALSAYMIGIVFMIGVNTLWYLGRQAAVDSAVRGFALIGQMAKPFDKLISKGSVEKVIEGSSER